MAEVSTGVFYLVLKQKKWSQLGARITTQQPKLASGERALRIDVKVPKALFQTPTLRASIEVPEGAVSRPVIDAAVIDNVREVIQQQTGLSVDVAVVEPTQLAEARGEHLSK